MTLYIGIPIVVAFFIFEALYSHSFKAGFLGKIKYRNIAYAFSSLFVLFIINKISPVIKSHIVFSLEVHRFTWLDYIGCFLFAELMNWLLHFIKHKKYFWNFHYQHHIDSHYSVLLTAHTHGIEVIFSGILIGTLMQMIGFSLEAINLYYVFYMIANTYQHSSFKLTLGFLDYLIVSPAYHRVHHSKSYRANYGSTLTFWDIVFRTAYFPSDFKQDIGIHQNGEPLGFIKEHLFGFEPIFRVLPNYRTLGFIIFCLLVI